MAIDFDSLREDLKNDSMGAFFGGGFGGAIFEAADIENATPEELIELAEEKGLDLSDYSF